MAVKEGGKEGRRDRADVSFYAFSLFRGREGGLCRFGLMTASSSLRYLNLCGL